MQSGTDDIKNYYSVETRKEKSGKAGVSHIEFGDLLTGLARNAIARGLGIEPPRTADPDDFRLAAKGASFVTLTKKGALRGCIGSLEARRPLYLDITENAVAAAFDDPRFAPVDSEEFDLIRIEVSLLEPPTVLPFVDEAGAMRSLVPGRDGLILSYGARRATFLPQVWEVLPDPAEFLRHLKMKAGLPADFWSGLISLSRYTVRKFAENT